MARVMEDGLLEEVMFELRHARGDGADTELVLPQSELRCPVSGKPMPDFKDLI